MSDYGFATYDEKTGKVAEKINSKYPIFGPDYAGINVHYRTTHINVLSTKTVKTADISVPAFDDEYEGPDGGDYLVGDAIYGSYEDVLVTRYEHGFTKRPIGYYMVTGTISKTLRYTLQQVQTRGSVGGNFTLSGGTQALTGTLIPRLSNMWSTEGLWGLDTIWGISMLEPKKLPVEDPETNIIIPNSCMEMFDYTTLSETNVRKAEVSPIAVNPPFRVEIDDKYVSIYQRSYWADHILNVKRTTSPVAQAYQRTKGIEDYVGSSVDVTVYLMPYSLEDLQ